MMQRLRQEKFVALFRRLTLEQSKRVCQALFKGGVRLIEVTFDPSDDATIEKTTAILNAIREEYGDEVDLLAGTVVKPEYVVPAKQAGAKMIVAPNTDEQIIRLTHENGMLSAPGAFTPTEIVHAHNLGADIVKIYPIEPHNIAYLKNILSPLSHIRFMATGGVNPQTAPEFIKLGATAVGAGASIITPQALADNDWAQIERNARLHVEAVKNI